MDEGPQIRAIVPWFGAKRNLASWIVGELGPHRSYWEPFCGSLAVLLAKPQAAMETVNDLNGDLINLAMVIRDPGLGPQLYRRMRRTLFSESLFRMEAEAWKARGRLVPPFAVDLDRACEFFLCSWMGRNGVAGTQSYNQGFCIRYSDTGGHGATRVTRAAQSIPWWRRRMRATTICCRDGIELCGEIADEPGTVIYADPPYLEKGARYVCDFTPEDHRRLAANLRRFRHARVLVSYYDHPLLEDLYPGWTRIGRTVSKSLANANVRGERGFSAREVLLINGLSLGVSSNSLPLAAALVREAAQ